MNIYTAIGLGITIAGFMGGIITSVAKLAVKTGQIMEKLQTNEKRDDWKIIKIYEARLSGESDPYDYEELKAARQAARDKINALQAQLEVAE